MDTALGFHGTGLERVWNGLERGLERDGQVFSKFTKSPTALCSTEKYFVVQSNTFQYFAVQRSTGAALCSTE